MTYVFVSRTSPHIIEFADSMIKLMQLPRLYSNMKLTSLTQTVPLDSECLLLYDSTHTHCALGFRMFIVHIHPTWIDFSYLFICISLTFSYTLTQGRTFGHCCKPHRKQQSKCSHYWQLWIHTTSWRFQVSVVNGGTFMDHIIRDQWVCL